MNVMADALSSSARRNRIIAGAAGVITVVAIVLAFASGYLGEPWQWLRPAGELLLLAELVGLIVLERHQLFEPVQENVGAIKQQLEVMDNRLGSLADKLDSGRLSICGNTPEVLRAVVRTMRTVLARDYPVPQILRISGLSGQLIARDAREGGAEAQDLPSALLGFAVLPSTTADARARRWTLRMLFGVGSREIFDAGLQAFAPIFEQTILNFDLKMFACPKVSPVLSPGVVTEREAVLVFDDQTASLRWAIMFDDRPGAALLARWFDDLWSAVPDTNLIYSRNGLNQKAIDRIREQLDAGDAPGVAGFPKSGAVR